jgi:hypothetical protein
VEQVAYSRSEFGRFLVVPGVGDDGKRIGDADAGRRRPVPQLSTSSYVEAINGLSPLLQLPDLWQLVRTKWRERRLQEWREELGTGLPVEPLAGPPHRRSPLERGHVREPGHVIEMEMGEDDVQLLRSGEEGRLGHQPVDPRARVDHQGAVPVANEDARRPPLRGGDPAAAAEQPRLHRPQRARPSLSTGE